MAFIFYQNFIDFDGSYLEVRLVLICGDVTLVGTCFQFHLKSGADDDDDDDDDYPTCRVVWKRQRKQTQR